MNVKLLFSARYLLWNTLFITLLSLNYYYTSSFTFVNDTYYDEHRLDNTKQWCHHISSTPEPEVIVYNRMPKCGGETLAHLIHQCFKSNGQGSWHTNIFEWVDFDEDIAHKRKMEMEIQLHVNKSKSGRIIVDGHWKQTSFNIGPYRMESIQQIRECKSKKRSNFFYYLNEKNKTEEEIRSHVLQIKNSSTTIDECIHDIHCLENAKPVSFDAVRDLHFLCGSQCAKSHRPAGMKMNLGYINGALANLHDPSVYAVIGTLETLNQTLEMFECVYPQSMKGIRAMYSALANPIKNSSRKENVTALELLLDRACDRKVNGYVEVYEEIQKTALSRYQYMKSQGNKCCRKI